MFLNGRCVLRMSLFIMAAMWWWFFTISHFSDVSLFLHNTGQYTLSNFEIRLNDIRGRLRASLRVTQKMCVLPRCHILHVCFMVTCLKYPMTSHLICEYGSIGLCPLSLHHTAYLQSMCDVKIGSC